MGRDADTRQPATASETPPLTEHWHGRTDHRVGCRCRSTLYPVRRRRRYAMISDERGELGEIAREKELEPTALRRGKKTGISLQEILLFGLVFRHSFKWASSQSQHARRRCGLACARRGRDYCMLFTARASQLHLPSTTLCCLDATVNIGGVVAQSAERL